MGRVRVAGHRRSIDVPGGWEARIFRHPGAAPVMHVASFALRDGDGDFGAAATGRMRPDDMFAALVEYRADAKIRPGHGLFAATSPPRPQPRDFSPFQLQVARRGQLGCQLFFTARGAPCSLYLVVQPARRRLSDMTKELAGVLATLRHERE
jgi:hypothetical protein